MLFLKWKLDFLNKHPKSQCLKVIRYKIKTERKIIDTNELKLISFLIVQVAVFPTAKKRVKYLDLMKIIVIRLTILQILTFIVITF